MATHPYISGAGNITQMVNQLRKSFPAVVTSDTVKKYQIAPNNESYVINALQFLGILDAESKKTNAAKEVFSKHDDEDFQTALAELVKPAYSELFELHGDGAWSLDRKKLTGYFRQADKTSEAIGARQASVFSVLSVLCGKSFEINISPGSAAKSNANGKVKISTSVPKMPIKKPMAAELEIDKQSDFDGLQSAVTLNVRIEVNLPSGVDSQTYDAIFSSIRKNLMNG